MCKIKDLLLRSALKWKKTEWGEEGGGEKSAHIVFFVLHTVLAHSKALLPLHTEKATPTPTFLTYSHCIMGTKKTIWCLKCLNDSENRICKLYGKNQKSHSSGQNRENRHIHSHGTSFFCCCPRMQSIQITCASDILLFTQFTVFNIR